MKVSIIYNRDSKKVINMIGQPNRERYRLMSIDRILRGLKAGGHQPRAFEGDKHVVNKLEEFMPPVMRSMRQNGRAGRRIIRRVAHEN